MATETLNLYVLTPEKAYPAQTVDSLSVMTSSGQEGILPHHCDYLANVDISLLTVVKDEKPEYYAVGGGVCRFNQSENACYLILRNIVNLKDVDLDKEKKAKALAAQKLKTALSEAEHKEVERQLQEAINRIDLKTSIH